MGKRIMKRLNKEHTAGIICTLPFTVGFLVFTIVPMLLSLYYSFTDYNIISKPHFVGLANYMEMFTRDKVFRKALRVTISYAVISVPLKLLFSLAVALLLEKKTRLTSFYRAVYYLPSIIGSSVAVAVLWKRIFAVDGVLNRVLTAVGIECSFPWLGNTKTALWVLILMTVWQFGSSMLTFLAALKQIPSSLMESARIDGGNRVQCFFRITVPLLTPTVFFNLVMQSINSFLAFSQCYIITKGNPMNSTLFYVVYMYQKAFEHSSMGYASAMAWVMLALVGTLTALLFATRKKWVYEG